MRILLMLLTSCVAMSTIDMSAHYLDIDSTSVSAGFHHTCAIALGKGLGGAMQCWGENASGQCDNYGGAFLQVSAGREHTVSTSIDL